MMQNLMQSNESTDITLVCEDKIKFKAHKFILNACSPVFQSIINDLPQKDPVIYLRGVLAPEMKSILQFIYLGQATFYQDRMNDFLNVARSLEIKEISKDVESDIPDLSQDQEYDENMKHNFENSNPVIENSHEVETIVNSSNGQYPCRRCNKHFTQTGSLLRHIKTVHEGIKFSCDSCDQTFTQKGTLNTHIKTVHEGMKFPCDLCDHTFTQKASLYTHKKKIH